MTAQEKMKVLAEKIAREVVRGTGKGLEAGAIFVVGRTKEMASVQAPTRRTKSGRKVATTRAIPGAPLRVVTGLFRQKITYVMVNPQQGNYGGTQYTVSAIIGDSAHSEDGFSYPAHHEIKDSSHPSSGQHQTFAPTIERWKKEIKLIVGANVRTQVLGH